MTDASYVRKPVSEWTTPIIRNWMYAIEVRSDSVISEAEDSDDWSEYEADSKLHDELSAELKARGEKL